MASEPTAQVALPKVPTVTKPTQGLLSAAAPTTTGARPHTTTHTHEVSYSCACGALGKERTVTHAHRDGGEPHYHSNSDELLIGKDIKLAVAPQGYRQRREPDDLGKAPVKRRGCIDGADNWPGECLMLRCSRA